MDPLVPLSGSHDDSDKEPYIHYRQHDSRPAWVTLLTITAVGVGMAVHLANKVDPVAVRNAKIIELAKAEVTKNFVGLEPQLHKAPFVIHSIPDPYSVTVSALYGKGHDVVPITMSVWRSNFPYLDVLLKTRCWEEGSKPNAKKGLPVTLSISDVTNPDQPIRLFKERVCYSGDGVATSFVTTKPTAAATPAGPQ